MILQKPEFHFGSEFEAFSAALDKKFDQIFKYGLREGEGIKSNYEGTVL